MGKQDYEACDILLVGTSFRKQRTLEAAAEKSRAFGHPHPFVGNFWETKTAGGRWRQIPSF